jgi:hypothetical protein
MKILAGLGVGLLSGFLIYMTAAMVLGVSKPGGLFIVLTFFGGWALSSYIVIKGASSASKVMARGSLLGAIEWLLMIAATWIFAGHAVQQSIDTNGNDVAAKVGAGIGGGILGVLGSGLSLAMALVCVVSWFIFSRFNSEMKQDDTRKKIPCVSCAELIFADAKQCRFCNTAQDSATNSKAA